MGLFTTFCRECGHYRGRWPARYCTEPGCDCPTHPAPTVAKERRLDEEHDTDRAVS